MGSPIVKRYLIALNKYWFAIPVGFVLGTSGGFIFGEMFQAPASKNYVVEGSLQYTSPPITFSQTGTTIQQQGQILTQDATVLTAPDVLKAVNDKADLKADLKTLRKDIYVRVPKKDKEGVLDSNEVRVRYQAAEPEKGLLVVETMMQEMITKSRNLNRARVQAIINEINKRLPAVNADLRQAERQLQEFARREQTALLALQTGQLPGAIAGNEQQQRQLRLTLEGINAQMQSIEQQLGLDPNQAYASAALSADPIIADLRAKLYQIESQQALLVQSLRPEHPTLVQMDQQKQTLEQQLRDRAAEVIGGGGELPPLITGSQIRQDSSLDPARQQLAQMLVNLKTQREMALQQLKAAIQTEQELRRQYGTLPNKQLEQARLEQQVALKKSYYDAMQSKLLDAKTADAEAVSSLSVAQPPGISGEVVTSPLPLALLLVAGGLGGSLLGAAVVFLLGSLGGVLQTMEDIQSFLRDREVQLLGVLPFVDVYDPGFGGEDPMIVSPYSPYLEYYERFRSNLRQLEGGQSLKVLLIASTVKGEGKTVTAYNLAIAAARSGKRTLLVEGDLRSHSHAKSLSVAPDPASALEPLLYYGQLSECIRLVPDVENLYIVPSLGPHREASAILESPEMKQLLEDARTRFDFVVIDSATLSLCNDAFVLEPFSDGIILVTRPQRTGESMLTEAVEQLADNEQFRLLGAVINAEEMQVKPIVPVHPVPDVEVPTPEPPKAPAQKTPAQPKSTVKR